MHGHLKVKFSSKYCFSIIPNNLFTPYILFQNVSSKVNVCCSPGNTQVADHPRSAGHGRFLKFSFPFRNLSLPSSAAWRGGCNPLKIMEMMRFG